MDDFPCIGVILDCLQLCDAPRRSLQLFVDALIWEEWSCDANNFNFRMKGMAKRLRQKTRPDWLPCKSILIEFRTIASNASDSTRHSKYAPISNRVKVIDSSDFTVVSPFASSCITVGLFSESKGPSNLSLYESNVLEILLLVTCRLICTF